MWSAYVLQVGLLCFFAEHHAMKAYWWSGYIIHTFLTSAVDGGEWSASRPSCFTSKGKSPSYPFGRRLGGPQSRSGRGG